MNQKFDVIINGGGFAGLSAAAGLARLGLEIAIIETQSIKEIIDSSEARSDFRTTALSYFSRKYFESIGLWEAISKKAGAINHIIIKDADFVKGDSPLGLDFSSHDVEKDLGGFEPMGHIVENYYFKECLLNFCLAQKNVKFFEKESIVFLEQNSSYVEVDLSNDLTLKAKLLVVADGRNSSIRDMLKIKTFDREYNQIAITFNVKHELPHKQTALERFMPSGPFAVLPMFDENMSGIVWTVEANQAPFYMQMNDTDFNKEVGKKMGNYLGDFELITKRSAYPLKLKYAKQYYENKCVLIADSAHAIHPIAGQGFNQGCKDIELLVRLIKSNLEIGLDIADSALLEKYQSQRSLDNRQMIFATNFFVNVFSNESKALRAARRIGIKAVDKIPSIKKFFIKRAMGA